MRKIFIADAHLRAPEDANYRTLLRFLDTLPSDTDTLYLLGDIFEFWVGSPERVNPQYQPLLVGLKKVRGRGVRIVYFEGNHDFHLSRFFEEQLQAEVYREGARLELAGEPVYLCHGDQINRADWRYRVLRGVLHGPLVAALVPFVPDPLKDRIASAMAGRSRRQHQSRRDRWDYPSLLRRFAAERCRAGYRVVVTGHFHHPLFERHDGCVLLALGDWITQFSYGQWLDGEFSLRQFPR